MNAEEKLLKMCEVLEESLRAQLEWVALIRELLTPELEELVVAPWH